VGVPDDCTYNIMLKITNREQLSLIYKDSRPGDIIHSYADISKAKRLLKFESEYNQENGLKEYFKSYDDKYGTNLILN